MTERSRIERVAKLELAVRFAIKYLREGKPELAREVLEKVLAWQQQ